jgi:hypothetical protein
MISDLKSGTLDAPVAFRQTGFDHYSQPERFRDGVSCEHHRGPLDSGQQSLNREID